MEVNRHIYASLVDTQALYINNQMRDLRKGRDICIHNLNANDQKKIMDEMIIKEKLKVEKTIIYRTEECFKDEVDYWIYVRCFR